VTAVGTTPVPAAGLGEVPDHVVAAGTAHGRPTYVYDLETLRDRCREVGSLAIEPKSVFFATMANDHPRVVECVREAGHGVFVNSRRHLEIALSGGFDVEDVVYAASNMVEDEMRLCLAHGVRVVLDSTEQVRRYGRMAGPGHEVGLRVSVGYADGDTLRTDPGYRFGVLPEELPAAVAAARGQGLRIGGIHSYFGTDLPAEPLVEGIGRLAEVAATLPDVTFLDAGGGFCVPMPGEAPFDLGAYGSGVSGHLARLRLRLGRPVEFLVEPGRYLAASCGYFFVTVVDVKQRADRVFVGTTGSVAMFPRPLLYPERGVHPCGIVGRDPLEAADPRPIYVCGNSTYSQDFLARGIRLPLPCAGDTLVFGNAGAYCRSMATRFLGKERPVEVVLDGAASSSGVEELDALAETG
jgi:diaminopimelate decarboxylase